MRNEMRTLHLFGGVAGGLFADLILGHTPVCYVELNSHACRIVRGMVSAGWFPGLTVIEQSVADQPILGGAAVVAGFDPSHWKGRVDCLSAGFPCQDLSLAGKGAGIHGKRSGLYREAIRCIEVIRPAWVFLENVPAIRSRGRHVVIADLVALGYSYRDGVLAAADVGAPHLRKRWWCVAKRNDVADPAADTNGDQRAAGVQEHGGGGRRRASRSCRWRRCCGRRHAPGTGEAGARRAAGPGGMLHAFRRRLVGC